MPVCVMSSQKPTDELSRSYVSFMRVSIDQIRQKVADELYILTLFEVSCFITTARCVARKNTQITVIIPWKTRNRSSVCPEQSNLLYTFWYLWQTVSGFNQVLQQESNV